MHVCLDKSSFVLGNELWEEHFESLLALVKAYGRKGYMAMLNVLNNPVLTLQLRILRIFLGLMGRIVKGCVREVRLAQVSCILMYVYVALPTPVAIIYIIWFHNLLWDALSPKALSIVWVDQRKRGRKDTMS